MRIALFGLAALAITTLPNPPAQAVSYPVYPWCAEYSELAPSIVLVNGSGGGTNCYFSTLAQCQETVRGIGGTCIRNPFYGHAGYPADQPPARSRQRH